MHWKIYVEELIPRLSRHTNSLLVRQVLWLWTRLVLILVYLGGSLSLLYFLFVFLVYFMFGCTGFSWKDAGFSLCCLLLLQSMSSRHMDFSRCAVWTQLLHSMWDLPGPGVELLFPKLAGEFLPTVPPGKSICLLFLKDSFDRHSLGWQFLFF